MVRFAFIALKRALKNSLQYGQDEFISELNKIFKQLIAE